MYSTKRNTRIILQFNISIIDSCNIQHPYALAYKYEIDCVVWRLTFQHGKESAGRAAGTGHAHS